MKILILVLSYNESPYRELMEAQQSTFDSVETEGVKTIYYHGGLLGGGSFGISLRHRDPQAPWERLEFQCTDAYYLMANKFKKCLEYIDQQEYDYDYIFRTNSSSYVNKEKLKEFVADLPKEKLYAGWEIEGNAGYNVCSGAGFFLSRDTAEILRESIDPEFEREEDVYCAQLLHEKGIKIIDDKSRIDWPEYDKDIHSAYHIRFKGSHGNRYKDAEDMRLVHQKIMEKA